MDKAKRFLKIVQLKNKQRTCDKLYESEGLSDRVLDMQVEINTMRHELNIPEEDGFVQ